MLYQGESPQKRLAAVYQPIAYKTLFYWLLMLSLMLFGLFICWDLQLIQGLFSQDKTRISLVITAMLLVMTLHAGYRSLFIARQFLMFDQLFNRHAASTKSPHPTGTSIAQDYLVNAGVLQAEVLAERIRGSHQIGWFVTGAMLKLGLLGTVIGFVIMLGSIHGLETLDLSDIKALMQQMTEGMGIAMNTTIVGLVGSLLLSAQYLLLDRMADRFVQETLTLSEQAISDGTV